MSAVSRSTWPKIDLWAAELSIYEDDLEKVKVQKGYKTADNNSAIKTVALNF